MWQIRVLCFVLMLLLSCKKDPDLSGFTEIASMEKTIGTAHNEFARDVCIYDNKTLLFTGLQYDASSSIASCWLVYTDYNLNEWSQYKYSWGTYCEAIHSLVLPDKNILTCGIELSPLGDADILLFKTDRQGNVLWKKNFGGAQTEQVAKLNTDANGNIYIYGSTFSYGAGNRDAYLIKTDAVGNLIFQKTFGGINNDAATDIIRHNNHLYLFGFTYNFGAQDADYWVIKTNLNGDGLHSFLKGGPGYEEGQKILHTKDGGLFLAGHSASYEPNHDVYVVKTNLIGTTLWFETAGGHVHDGAQNAIEDEQGNVWVLARSNSRYTNNEDVYLLQYDKHGNKLFEQYYGSLGEDRCDGMVLTPKSVVIAGKTNGMGNGLYDMYIVKIPR